MRIDGWDSSRFDQQFENITMDRLEEAADLIAERAKQKCPTGTIVRPVYGTRNIRPKRSKESKYAGRIWTSRNPGRLKRSVRVSRKKTKSGKAFTKNLNVRIYAGHFTAYYPYWVEFGTVKTEQQAFLRPAFYGSESDVRKILGVR